jgi:hypothetical protein
MASKFKEFMGAKTKPNTPKESPMAAERLARFNGRMASICLETKCTSAEACAKDGWEFANDKKNFKPNADFSARVSSTLALGKRLHGQEQSPVEKRSEELILK